jgi:hypothetical protein
MTTFEHAIFAINGCLAAGLQKRYDWNLVAMAAVCAVLPDWDGLTLIGGAALFDQAHRAWGHNLLACVLMGAACGVCDYRFHLTGRAACWLVRRLQSPSHGAVHHGNDTHEQTSGDEDCSAVARQRSRTPSGYIVWATVGVLAALSHLAADLVFSGGAGLSDWELRLGWPFSDRGFVYPLVPWGDVGVTAIFVIGMFAMLRWRKRTSSIAGATLAAAVLYAILRGTISL